MMSSQYGTAVPMASPSAYQPDYMYDDWSRQMIATANSRRFSRGSNGQRSGGAMRIVKPTSASNSPRSSMLAASRRRTVVNEGIQARIRQQLMDQAMISAALAEPTYDALSDIDRRSSRPVSWHPGTQLQLQQQQQQQQQQHQQHQQHQQQQQYRQVPSQLQQPGSSAPAIPSPLCYPADHLSTYPQFSPVVTDYSCHTSPGAFSPISLPFTDYPQTNQYLPNDDWTLATQRTAMAGPEASQPQVMMGGSGPFVAPEPTCGRPVNTTSSQPQGLDWSAFATHGFNMPPTPDSFPPAPISAPAVTPEESIPYHSLAHEDKDEDGSEILIGMGLYDTPEKDFADTGLFNYHTTTSHLLGTATGKGLKLLEAWEPPVSDDGEDQDDDDEDGEGEADDEK